MQCRRNCERPCIGAPTTRGEEISRAQIFNLPVPVSLEDIKRWNDVLVAYDAPRLEREMRDAIVRLDQVVGHCLGLDDGDIAEIQRDLKSDPFLRRIRPCYPGTVTRKQGFRSGLDSERRYQLSKKMAHHCNRDKTSPCGTCTIRF